MDMTPAKTNRMPPLPSSLKRASVSHFFLRLRVVFGAFLVRSSLLSAFSNAAMLTMPL